MAPSEEIAPTGVKLHRLYFSPLHLFHRARIGRYDIWPVRKDAFPCLPKTITELEKYLDSTIAGAADHGLPFEQMVGVSIRSIAWFMIDLRSSHPALFLLLLSEDIDHALVLMPSLGYSGGRNPCTAWRERYFADTTCTIAEVFEILRLLRRSCDIIAALRKDRDFTISALRREQDNVRFGLPGEKNRSLLKRVNLSVFALRKIVLMDIDRHDDWGLPPASHRFRRKRSDSGTWSTVQCLAGPDRRYSATVLDDFVENATGHLPVGIEPPLIAPELSAFPVARVTLKGGRRRDSLANFYGLDGYEIAATAAIEVNRIAGGKASKAKIGALANALVRATGYALENRDMIRTLHINNAYRLRHVLLPGHGQFGHSAGFEQSSWHDLEGDKESWMLLAEARSASDPFSQLLLDTRRYLLAWTTDVRRLHRLDEAARIFCYLAQSLCPLSTDPVWIRLQERSRIVLDVRNKKRELKKDRSQMFELMSLEFAASEGCAYALDGSSSQAKEIVDLNDRLSATQTLDALSHAVSDLDRIAHDRHHKPRYCMITYDHRTRQVSVRYLYSPAKLDSVMENGGDPSVEPDRYSMVIVELDKIENLKEAYPNYFGDVQLFRSSLAEVVNGRPVKEYSLPPIERMPPPPRQIADDSWLRFPQRRNRRWEA